MDQRFVFFEREEDHIQNNFHKFLELSSIFKKGLVELVQDGWSKLYNRYGFKKDALLSACDKMIPSWFWAVPLRYEASEPGEYARNIMCSQVVGESDGATSLLFPLRAVESTNKYFTKFIFQCAKTDSLIEKNEKSPYLDRRYDILPWLPPQKKLVVLLSPPVLAEQLAGNPESCSHRLRPLVAMQGGKVRKWPDGSLDRSA